MATARKTIVGTTWTAITTAGQSGSVFQLAGSQVVIDHSTTGSATCSIDKSYPLNILHSPTDIFKIEADDSYDIFYAICPSETAVSSVIVDAV